MTGPWIDPVVLPSKLLAKAWLNVWGATGDDEKRWTLWRTVNVEVFPDDGVRLWATNSYLFFRAFVPLAKYVDDDGPVFEEPSVSREPAVTLVVQDRDRRALALFSWLAGPEQKDGDGGPPKTTVLSTGRMEDDLQPRLGDAVDPWGLLIVTPDARQFVPFGEFEPTDWRKLAANRDPDEVSGVSLGAKNLRALARLAGQATDGALTQQFTGVNQVVVIRAECEPPVDGLVMPVRKDAPPPDEVEPFEAAVRKAYRDGEAEVEVDLDDLDRRSGLDELDG